MRILPALITILLLTIVSTGEAQQDFEKKQAIRKEVIKLSRLGRNLEDAGRFNDALKVWDQVDEISPNDYNSYEGTRRCLVALQRFDEAHQFVNTALESTRSRRTGLDVTMLTADKVDILFAAGKRDAALIEAERAINEFKGNATIYSELSRVFAAQGQSDLVVETMLRGRNDTNEPGLFARDLAGWYEARMNWEGAVAEYLLYMRESKGRDRYVTGALADMPAHLGADSVAREVIAHAIDTTKGEFQLKLRDLLASLYFSAKIYDKALEQYKALDKAGKEAGGELLRFAQQLQDEHEYSLAIEAYNELLAKELSGGLKGKTLLGKAACLLGLNQVDSARTVLAEVLKPGSEPESVVVAHSELGRIALDFDNDPAAASAQYERAVKLAERLNHNPILIEELQVKAAIVKARSGDFDGAERDLIRLLKSQRSQSDALAMARNELAWLAYRQGEFQKAGQRINELMMSDPSSDFSNDALTLKALLADLKDAGEELIKLAAADKAIYLRQFEAADDLLDSLITSTRSRLQEEAYWLRWQAGLLQHQYEPALTALDGIIDLGGKAMRPDLALLRAAELCTSVIDDQNKAIAYYERILIEYPDSPLVSHARRQLLALEETS